PAQTALFKTGPSIGKLIVKAVSTSKEKSGVSLAALKKALAAGGYVVEKNNSRFKIIAVKSLVTKGTLVQTKGTGATKLNKKQAETMTKTHQENRSKAKKPAAKKPAAAKKPKRRSPLLKNLRRRLRNPLLKQQRRAPKKANKPVTPKKAAKSPKKIKAAKPKTVKPKATKPKKTAAKKK
uniref:H15 domain-containing protein n=1 Tax=Sinocyclocheilus anshuiensis TaxID=1608454 RepID=A0A671PZW8_9TELE